jgi:hypothetical protein
MPATREQPVLLPGSRHGGTTMDRARLGLLRRARRCTAGAAVAAISLSTLVIVAPPSAAAVVGNDARSSAVVLSGEDYSTEQSTAGATLEAGEQVCDDMGATVWYQVTLSGEAAIGFYVDTGRYENGALVDTFAPLIGLYSQDDAGRLTQRGCQGTQLGNAINIGSANLPAGTYFIQIGGYRGQTGHIRFSVESNVGNGGSGGTPDGENYSSNAMVGSVDCMEQTLPRNDDNSTTQVGLPFALDFYGEPQQQLWVNNNGNVTFDGPLSTFTPFGLLSTSRKIIAPFFGDVDTRASGSDEVRYGFGDGIYEGHRAFCVNWDGVGYYSYGTDKLNSFQLLLVEREDSGPGDFDIVFNYGSIRWETGSASGGSGGLGGSSARAGFSNGAEQAFELAGSGVNGSFLDSSLDGLARTATDSQVPGRHVFRVRNGNAPPTTYVALGDSFQSGEGAYDYEPGTDTETNKCHRSAHAYSRQLVRDGVVDLDLDFGACSGAVIDDLPVSSWPDAPPYNDGISQYDRLDEDTKLVTIGIGGNDVEFGPVLEACIKETILVGLRSCESVSGDRVSENILNLVTRDPTTGLNKLQTVYDEVRRRAPYARVLVVGYPRFYVEGGATDNAFGLCSGVRITDQRWINEQIELFDRAIGASARSAGAEYVNIYDTPAGHELCSGNEEFMQGLRLPPEAYHPNILGHSLITQTIARTLRAPRPGTTYSIKPGQTVQTTYSVKGGETATISTNWPVSDVVLTLRSPSGRVITRGAEAGDLQHRVGPTYELWTIEDPEPGPWTIEMYGRQVAELGEPTTLLITEEQAPGQAPVARIDVHQDGRSVTVDAGSSSDADGVVTDFLWEFGDGTTATGRRVTHRYDTAGDYRITLAVKDDSGHEAFAAIEGAITIPRYEFSGFQAPVSAQPALNTARAGRRIPIKFGLGGDHGLDILPAGSPSSARIDCQAATTLSEVEGTTTAGDSTLSYDAESGTYTYVWKTSTAWAGTCRRFTLALDDGSQYAADFLFKP